MKYKYFLLTSLCSCSVVNNPDAVVAAPSCAEAYQDPTKYLSQLNQTSYTLYEAVHDCVCSIDSCEAIFKFECDNDSVGSLILQSCQDALSFCQNQILNCESDTQ
jgi:hypothetical protein